MNVLCIPHTVTLFTDFTGKYTPSILLPIYLFFIFLCCEFVTQIANLMHVRMRDTFLFLFFRYERVHMHTTQLSMLKEKK